MVRNVSQNARIVRPLTAMKMRGSCTKIEIHSRELIDRNSIILSSCEHRDLSRLEHFCTDLRLRSRFSRHARAFHDAKKKKKRERVMRARHAHESKSLLTTFAHRLLSALKVLFIYTCLDILLRLFSLNGTSAHSRLDVFPESPFQICILINREGN